MRRQLKMIERSTTVGSEIKQHWMDYCNNATIDGLHYIGGTVYKSKNVRIGFAICLLVYLILVIYQCYKYVLEYRNYEVLTTITYDAVHSLPFPAITFCNAYYIKKSSAGISTETLYASSLLIAMTMEEVPLIYEQSKKPCLITGMNLSFQLEMGMKFMSRFYNADFTAVLKEIGIDSFMSVKKCWWNNREINCSNIFANHYFENVFCFTFNQDAADLDVGDVFTSYGLSKSKKATRNISNTGQAGFRVLLNPRQDEYCFAPHIRYGVGFHVAIHNVQSLPSTQLLSYIELSPGFEHNIVLQPQLFDRRNFSESRGNCTSDAFSFLTPNSDVYNQEKCISACMIETIFRRCNCLLVPNNSTLISNKTANFLGVENLRNCQFMNSKMETDYGCIKMMAFEFAFASFEKSCPRCKKKCLDILYDYQIFSRKFSNITINSLRSAVYNSSESVRKNFIIANFKLEDMQLITVRELQLITPLDLFINIANSVGLFFGLSILTPYEIIHQIVISTFTIIFKHKKTTITKVRKIKNVATRKGENNTLVTKKQMRK